tara:strand:+ start:239 stop:829 length:591 start_codon:yes stop_codon:yes gene_type:complete
MASELTVQTLRGPTSGTNANKVLIPSGQTLDTSAAGLVTPAGHVLQVQHAILTTIYASTVANTWLDINNLVINVTPVSTSSKIHVSFNLNAMIVSDNQRAAVRIIRDSTAIDVATDTGNRTPSSSMFAGISDPAYHTQHISNSALDSPNTTNQVTYKVQVRCENTTEIKINQQDNDSNAESHFRAVSTMTLMEIAG